MLAVVAADGHISEKEVRDVNVRTHRMRLFASQSPAEFREMIAGLFRILKEGGPGELIRRGAPSLPPELSETAFAMATDMIFAGGFVEDEEVLMARLQSELGIRDELAEQIFDVMIIKHRS